MTTATIKPHPRSSHEHGDRPDRQQRRRLPRLRRPRRCAAARPPTVQAWTCTACGLHWCTTVVNPNVGAALAVIGMLPTPQQCTAVLLDLMRSEVHRRSGKEHATAETVCLPATELFNLDPLASVDTVVWRCRLCDVEGSARYRLAAHTDAVAHLVGEHRATISSAP